MGRSRTARRSVELVSTVGVAVLLGACSSGSPGASTAATSESTTAATASAPPATSATTPAGSTASATTVAGGRLTIDPCRIVSASEASALTGAHFGKGVTKTTSAASKICVYGGSGLTVLDVIVAEAATPQAARAAFDSERARAQSYLGQGLPASIKVSFTPTNVSGIGDRATVGAGSVNLGGTVIKGSAIYVLKGTTFFAISGINATGAAASAGALKAEATKVLGRI